MSEPLPVQNQDHPAGVDRLMAAGPGIIRGVIHGVLGNKSNSKRLVIIKGRLVPIKEKAALAYEEKFEDAVFASLGNLSPLEGERFYLKAKIYYENMRRDLDGELLPDLLQKAGILKNDRLLWRKEYERGIDKNNPRVEFEIGVISGEGDGGNG